MARAVLLALAALCCSCSAFLTAVSNIRECVNDGSGELLARNGSACGKRLVVAMTVEADEGKSQYLEANIRRVQDSTTNTNVQLRRPVRIRITKSPVLINYRLYQVGYVNHRPREEMLYEKNNWCRDDWFARDDEAACGFYYNKQGKIFDSQGFCCYCDEHDHGYDRGEFKKCLNRNGAHFGHCLRFDHLYHYAMGFYPPQLMFTINITIEQVTYTRTTGESLYEVLDSIVLSPFKRRASLRNFTIQAEYIADFHSSDYMPSLAHKYLLVPDYKLLERPPQLWKLWAKKNGYMDSVRNPAEWLAVGKEKFGLSGYHCNRIGVYYSAFRNQPDACTSVFGSCLQGQPHQLWEEDMRRHKEGRPGLFMLRNFGKVHNTNTNTDNTADFQVNFIADRVRRSLITIRMEADSLRVVVNKSPGRIVEAYIEAFEALSSEGLLIIIVQNIGSITATYKVFAARCSAGVDYIPEKSVTIDPGQETNVTFTVHSFHAIGRINTCEVEMVDQTGRRLDNLTVYFQTADTCFCHGHCGCSCGDNTTNCPPPPDRHDPYIHNTGFNFLWNLNISAIDLGIDLNGFLLGNLSALFLTTWVIGILFVLGALKVLILVQTGQANCLLFIKIFNCCAQSVCRCFSVCCEKCCCGTLLSSIWCCTVCVKGVGSIATGDTSSNDRPPACCDGTCQGARDARRIHRKNLRLLKRSGADTSKMPSWGEIPYNCTHEKISDTKSLCEIIFGLFFFFYCPLLPFWWILEISYERCMRNRRKSRRKAAFRMKKEVKREKDKKTFLLLDKFSRGRKQKKVIGLTNAATGEEDNGKKNIDMISMEEGKVIDDESALELGLSANDTTDTDEAADIDELLNPGYPVYFNYPEISKKLIPESLKNPGNRFSVKGRLTKRNGTLVFYLYKFTEQYQQQVDNIVQPLNRPVKLDPEEFYKELEQELALQVITLAPLYPCLNDQRKIKKRGK